MSNVMDKCSSAIRGVFIASAGKKFVVADLAGIENRVLAWLAGEAWKLEAFLDFDLRDGHDMYKLAYAKAFGIDPASVDKHQRSIGKVLELMLGYAGGVGAYITGALTYRIDLEDMAEKAWDVIPSATRDDAASFLEWQLGQGKSQYGLSDRAFIVCDSFKRLWRETNPAIAAWWKELEDVVRRAINNPGQTLTCRMHKIRRDGAWLRIMLPSGRYLCYPNPRVEDDGGITFMGVNQFTRKWERLRTYGGRLVENCISEGTEVLTENHGWLAIERVTPDSRVWDGDEWVSFSHCHYSGKQTTISTYGVRMTPDHLVLTEEGWKNASSCERHNRAACRLPDGYSLPGIGRQEVDMGSGLRLRQSNSHGSLPAKEELAEGRQMLVRLHEESDHIFSPFSPRYERSSGFRSMAVNAGSVPTSYASGLQKLWRKGNSSLRAVAGKVRKLLGRHGSEVSPRVDIGALGQLARVFGGELRLANTQAPSQQHPSQPLDSHSSRPDDVHGSLGVLRSGVLDPLVSLGPRVAGRASPDTRRVFDLVNCGPRSRFVVRGDDGLPLIVHNCCQAVARDVLAYSLPSIEKAGYEIVLTVHDEIISEAPDTDEYTHEHLAELMSAGCDWTEGLPLAAAGFEAKRYRKG